jgi:hypothetical protein
MAVKTGEEISIYDKCEVVLSSKHTVLNTLGSPSENYDLSMAYP